MYPQSIEATKDGRLCLRLLAWHGGQWSAVYALGSSWLGHMYRAETPAEAAAFATEQAEACRLTDALKELHRTLADVETRPDSYDDGAADDLRALLDALGRRFPHPHGPAWLAPVLAALDAADLRPGSVETGEADGRPFAVLVWPEASARVCARPLPNASATFSPEYATFDANGAGVAVSFHFVSPRNFPAEEAPAAFARVASLFTGPGAVTAPRLATSGQFRGDLFRVRRIYDAHRGDGATCEVQVWAQGSETWEDFCTETAAEVRRLSRRATYAERVNAREASPEPPADVTEAELEEASRRRAN